MRKGKNELYGTWRCNRLTKRFFANDMKRRARNDSPNKYNFSPFQFLIAL